MANEYGREAAQYRPPPARKEKFLLVTALKLADQEVANHFAAGDVGGPPESREIEGAGEAVGEAKEEHRGDPAASVLESEAALGHAVLLDGTTAEVVDGTGGVNLGLKGAGGIGGLSTGEDVEVVVGSVATGVALGADGGTEDDEVLGDAWGGWRMSVPGPAIEELGGGTREEKRRG